MLLTACDEKYLLAEASVLIKSCARHEPDQPFYLFLVNSTSIPDAAIQAWHPDITIERVTWPYEAERWRALMCCARSIPLQKALETYQEPTIYLDSDMLVRGPLTELFELLQTYDLLVQFRPERVQMGAAGTPYGSTFNNGVIALRPSAAGIRFARTYNHALREFIASGKPLEVYREEEGISFVVDQELLYLTYLKLQDELAFKPLPVKFNDTKLDPTRLIWHGKGMLRNRPQYIREKLRYTHKLLYYPFSLYYGLYRLQRKSEYEIRKLRQVI